VTAVGRLEGRVAVITGSSMGIGRGIAERYATEGAAVVVNSRDGGRAETAAEELRSAGHRAVGVAGDVTDPGRMRALADAAVEAFGGLDVWVNNAGINAIGPSDELDPEAFRRVVEVNLGGCFNGAQAAARVMIPRGRGVIVQVGSILGRTAFPMRAAYTSAKHGLLGLTKVLAAEWARRGIRVVCIDPAYIRTALDEADQATGGYSDADIERRTPMGRYGTVQEVAGVAVFVASDEASYVTGSSVTVDGGWLAYGGW
jgi:3-oxoacyl-[acyl-carrier protein] reductase